MKIAVCIKQVVTREWQVRVNDDKTWVRDADASWELNEPDAYALEEALRRFSLRMPLPEVRLFVTVLTMQARSGGGLSEALSNLSTVLRARRKLRLRIKAMSSEAKSSALIIGALPIILGLVLHFASPNYIGLMFTHGIGRAVLGVCAVWMLIGVLVMRRMIDLRI